MALVDSLVRFARKPSHEKRAALSATIRATLRKPPDAEPETARRIERAIDRVGMLLKEDYLARLLQTGRYADPKRLERHGAKIYSQTDEDGIIAEIFSRIGVTDKRF